MSLGLGDLVGGWLHGRSLARGLPAPVRDGGGWRVETGAPTERARLVYSGALPEIVERAETIRTKDIPIKVCCPAAELQVLLGPRWAVEETGTFMTGPADAALPAGVAMPAGYALEVEQTGATGAVRIRDGARAIVASGYCAETQGVFVFDHIATHAGHRRRGLGRAMMAALAHLQSDPRAMPALVATADARALYRTLGWRDLAPYATARRVMEWSG